MTRILPRWYTEDVADFASLSDDALARAWRQVGLEVPPEMVQETVRRGERMVPALASMITDSRLWETDAPDRWAPAHALFLLAAIGSPSAAPSVAQFLREGLGGDWLTQAGHVLVYAMGPDDSAWEVLRDPDANEWGRAEAAVGLTMLALSRPELRTDTIEKLRDVAAGLDPAQDSTLLTWLCYSLADLHDAVSKSSILDAIEKGHVEWDPEGVELAYDTPFEDSLARWGFAPLEHFDPASLESLRRESEK